MQTLSTTDSSALLNPLGAELQSLIIDGKERMWTADPAWWGRHSPVLFPVVGKSKNDKISVDGQTFAMGQHGFARDRAFEVLAGAEEKSVSYVLYDSGETLSRFPFPFELKLTYTLLKNGIHLRYEVFNPGNRPLPFALGAHPGFLIPEGKMDEMMIHFSEEENFDRHLLEAGLFDGKTLSMGNGKTLSLKQSDFDLDAIVFKNIQSRSIRLTGPETNIEMQFGGFEDLGIWTKQGCSKFLCLEPWHGYADSTNGPDELEKRQGIHLLEAGKTFEAFWQVNFMA